MKFGKTLQQRSVPQWTHYNVDYDGIKTLIKDQTTYEDPTSPMSIPGQATPLGEVPDFENDLLDLLKAEHDRVTLFIKTKYGEISRRLDYIDRYCQRQSQQSQSQGKVPSSKSRRYFQLVSSVEEAGEEIQALSRFIVAQKTAFRKLLKKYRKWTRSVSLEKKLDVQAFGRRDGSLDPGLDSLTSQFMLIRDALQALQIRDQNMLKSNGQKGHDISQKSRTSRRHSLDQAFAQKLQLNFDAIFGQPSAKSSRARYWIHVDDIPEVRILLKRCMKDYTPTSSPNLSRRQSNTLIQNQEAVKLDHTASLQSRALSVALIDNAQIFVKNHTAANIGSSEEAIIQSPLHASVAIYRNRDDQSGAVISQRHPQTKDTPQVIECGNRDVAKLLDNCFPLSNQTVKDSKAQNGTVPQDVMKVEEWLKSRPDPQNLTNISMQRLRYQGTQNDGGQCLWAILDTDISVSLATPTGEHQLLDTSREPQEELKFPHAVLEIRWEGSQTPEIVRRLDKSHLAERVRGFSLEAFAIYSLFASDKATAPVWQPLLEQDIRKLPPKQHPRTTRKDRPSLDPTPDASTAPSSADGPSDGTFSTQFIPSSATSPVETMAEDTAENIDQKERAKSPHKRALRRNPTTNQSQRYWNEFDDIENNEVEPYTILVDPDAPINFPGYQAIRSLLEKLRSPFSHPRGDHDKANIAERQALLPKTDANPSSPTSIETSDESDDAAILRRPSHPRLHHPRPRRLTRRTSTRLTPARRQSRETAIFYTYLGCFAASFALLIVTSVLETTGRRKAAVQVDAGVLVGVSAAFVFGLLGVCLMFTRKETLGWAHRSAVGLATLVVVGVCAWEVDVVVHGQ
ncbi:MAG: hypothetical protein Q9227_008591 [Pyrenula ochraceoflavens]